MDGTMGSNRNGLSGGRNIKGYPTNVGLGGKPQQHGGDVRALELCFAGSRHHAPSPDPGVSFANI